MVSTEFISAIALQLKEFWFVYLIFMIIGLIGTWLWYEQKSKLERFGPEIAIRKEAYFKRKAIGRVIDKGGREFEFIISPDKEYPGLIDTKNKKGSKATLREPSIVSARARGTTSNGIPIYNFFVGYDFPMPFRSAVALTELADYIHNEYPELRWLGDVAIIQGVFNDTEYAYDDCMNLVKQYIELGIEIPDEFYENPINEEPIEPIDYENIDNYDEEDEDTNEGDEE